VRPGPALWTAIEEHAEGLGRGHRGYEEGDGSNSNETECASVLGQNNERRKRWDSGEG